jgi:hypothetical protein
LPLRDQNFMPGFHIIEKLRDVFSQFFRVRSFCHVANLAVSSHFVEWGLFIQEKGERKFPFAFHVFRFEFA